MAVPQRDTLIITGSDDPAGLQYMAEVMESKMAADHPISGVPLILRCGEWETFVPPPQVAKYRGLRKVCLGHMAAEYNAQADVLHHLSRMNDADIFVGHLMLPTDPDTECRSAAVWTKGVKTLLPQADEIGFCELDLARRTARLTVATWEDVTAVVGELMKDIGTYPKRFLVTGFPVPEQLSRIAVEEI